jgi:hypothetical protein
MSYGRIKRNRRKVAEAARYKPGKRNIHRHLKVSVRLHRGIAKAAGRYGAQACVAGRGKERRRCSPNVVARTPQSAIAKALKKLSQTIARRK